MIKTAPNAMQGKKKETQYPGDTRTLLGMDFEMEKMIRFLREIEIFEKI